MTDDNSSLENHCVGKNTSILRVSKQLLVGTSVLLELCRGWRVAGGKFPPRSRCAVLAGTRTMVPLLGLQTHCSTHTRSKGGNGISRTHVEKQKWRSRSGEGTFLCLPLVPVSAVKLKEGFIIYYYSQ